MISVLGKPLFLLAAHTLYQPSSMVVSFFFTGWMDGDVPIYSSCAPVLVVARLESHSFHSRKTRKGGPGYLVLVGR